MFVKKMVRSILETTVLIQKHFSLTIMMLQAFHFVVMSIINHPGQPGCQIALQHGVRLAKIIKQRLGKEKSSADDEWGDQKGMRVRKRYR